MEQLEDEENTNKKNMLMLYASLKPVLGFACSCLYTLYSEHDRKANS